MLDTSFAEFFHRQRIKRRVIVVQADSRNSVQLGIPFDDRQFCQFCGNNQVVQRFVLIGSKLVYVDYLSIQPVLANKLKFVPEFLNQVGHKCISQKRFRFTKHLIYLVISFVVVAVLQFEFNDFKDLKHVPLGNSQIVACGRYKIAISRAQACCWVHELVKGIHILTKKIK
ncbi:hypothetical protein OGATHE_000134 [Ogataea polymorpha]|uniref:Uncharacterized protein n=1 Tax=Ogataea polymorpha TaxID=460523 RepID=A0A9P8PWK4_9ASCO|nr:hypothetical protein OGATHE_000134 [Ogataea polymorpha]